MTVIGGSGVQYSGIQCHVAIIVNFCTPRVYYTINSCTKNGFLRARRPESCDCCTFIGSADIPVGATEQCPESTDLLSMHVLVINNTSRAAEKGLVYQTNTQMHIIIISQHAFSYSMNLHINHEYKLELHLTLSCLSDTPQKVPIASL